MARLLVIKVLIGGISMAGVLGGALYWLQNNWNSNYIAAKCEKRVKARCSPAVLQSWATNLIAHADDFTNTLSPSFPVPRELDGIWKYRPAVFIREAHGGSEAYVDLSWGSGVLGHWGLSVGSPTFVPAQWAQQGVQWQSGIYFWRDCH